MRKLVLTAIVLSFVLAGQAAQADHYGGVPRFYEQKMERYIHAWFDRLGASERMIGVMCHESGGNPLAVNYAGPVAGLLQIRWPAWSANNPAVHWSIKRFWHFRHTTFQQFYDRLKDPVQSIRLAYLIYRHHGDQWGGESSC